MKSNIPHQKMIPAAKVDNYVKEEWEKQYDELFERAKDDIVAQVLGVCMFSLAKEFGFGKNRLKKFYSSVEGFFKIIEKKGAFGKRFNTIDIINQIKKDYGIDLDEKGIFKPKDE